MVLDLVSLAVHARTAANLSDALGTGVVAGFALLLADALLLPNAALATVGYLTGPGFAVGSGTSVSLAGAHVGSAQDVEQRLARAWPTAGAVSPVGQPLLGLRERFA